MAILNYFYVFFILLINQPDPWITYKENENFLISYKLERCNDVKNGFDFNVYLIKLTNKTGKTLVVDFVLGDPINPRQREEDKVIVILGKRESKEGKEIIKEKNNSLYKEYLEQKQKETEMLKTIPPNLKPYYKNKVNEYFKNMDGI